MSKVRMGIVVTAVGLIMSASVVSAQAPAAAQSLDRGIAAFRAADYETAVKDLDAAAESYLSPDQMQHYVNTGQMASLDKLETALVYLALAHSRRGSESQARDAILRLITAERIAPTLTTLGIPAEVAAVEALAARLVPETPLKPVATTGQIAQARPPAQSRPQPPVTAPATTTQPTPVPVAQTPPAAAAPAPAAPSLLERELVAQLERERSEREKMIEQRLAEERAKIEREAQARIAAAERSAQQQIVAVERSIEERVAAERAQQRVALPPIVGRRAWLTALREAYAFAAAGQHRQANAIYNRMADDDGVPRDVLAEAAIGLYQTGSYREAVHAFERFGTFARGDEDLRYYHAVALYEMGRYADARHELTCALPFIEMTDHVTRYRAKIEAAAR